MSRIIGVFAGAGLCLAVAACSTQGTGTAEVVDARVGAERGDRAAVFQWSSDGSSVTEGRLLASVPGHDAFVGEYTQVAAPSRANDPNPAPGTSGQMVATLNNHYGETMRCQFTLSAPEKGPEGGGTGECLLDNGVRISNATLRSD